MHWTDNCRGEFLDALRREAATYGPETKTMLEDLVINGQLNLGRVLTFTDVWNIAAKDLRDYTGLGWDRDLELAQIYLNILKALSTYVQ